MLCLLDGSSFHFLLYFFFLRLLFTFILEPFLFFPRLCSAADPLFEWQRNQRLPNSSPSALKKRKENSRVVSCFHRFALLLLPTSTYFIFFFFFVFFVHFLVVVFFLLFSIYWSQQQHFTALYFIDRYCIYSREWKTIRETIVGYSINCLSFKS